MSNLLGSVSPYIPAIPGITPPSSNTTSASDNSPCPAFSITDPMPSIQCNLKKDIIYIIELSVIVAVILFGFYLLFEHQYTAIKQTGGKVVNTAIKGAALLA